jgi:threonine dehydrogenase-like Zn-dependent dehydrogenase
VTQTARTLWLDSPGELAFREAELAPPGPGEICCATIVSAISPGTELAAYRGLPHLHNYVTFPRLLGYCNVARVLAAGEGVSGVAPGDRVLTHQAHRSHFVVPADQVLVRLEEADDAGAIACAYLYHLGYNAVLRSEVRAGSRVLVIGLGALGLTSVAMAAIAGAEVIGVSAHERPARLARESGARDVLSREQIESSPPFAEGADVVIATTNGWGDWHLALRQAGQRGTIACVGFPGRGEPPPEFNPIGPEHFYAKQLRIEAVGASPQRPDPRGFARFNERANLAYLAGLIREGRLRTELIVSGRYPADEVERAYRDLIDRRESPVTYLLDWPC